MNERLRRLTVDANPGLLTVEERTEVNTMVAEPQDGGRLVVFDGADDPTCGCCELGDYDGDRDSDQPWCQVCNHSPEEHEPDEAR